MEIEDWTWDKRSQPKRSLCASQESDARQLYEDHPPQKKKIQGCEAVSELSLVDKGN